MTATDSASLIRGNTSLAIDLYRLQATASRENIFFSPYSISTAMAMADAGARGTTAAEIEKAMHLPFGGTKLAGSWAALHNDINRTREGITLLTANALWAAKDIEVKPEYLSLARKDFGAKVETVDFAKSEAARKHINAWVSETTRKMITELIGSGMLDAATRLVLTNAIYMKADWLHPFPKERTDANGVFHTAAGDRKAALMRNFDDFRYARMDGVRIIEFPYRADLSMMVILPDAVDGLPAIEKTLSAEKLDQWEKALTSQKVDVTFPRFKADLQMLLAEAFRSLGIRQAFSGHADFSGIAKEPLTISEAIHRARIDVDEKGTEAAAATAVIMTRATSVQPRPQPETFKADHPFLYLIRSNDAKTVLFIGRMGQPN